MSETHVDLFTGHQRGERTYEPVHVAQVGDDIYRVLYSPVLVYGVAADDLIRLLPEGEFEMVERGQNLAIRVFSEDPIKQMAGSLVTQVVRLGGRVDGGVQYGLAFTVPVSAGFPSVEAVFKHFAGTQPGCLWEYGNVFDQSGQPLSWWPTPG